MRLLMDTHVLLWWLEGSSRLSPAADAALADPANEVFCSAATFWEIHLKASLGKLRVPPGLEVILKEEGIQELPIRYLHSQALGSLPWHHKDPFDRMLLAQCLEEDLTLLTGDSSLAAYADLVTILPAARP